MTNLSFLTGPLTTTTRTTRETDIRRDYEIQPPPQQQPPTTTTTTRTENETRRNHQIVRPPGGPPPPPPSDLTTTRTTRETDIRRNYELYPGPRYPGDTTTTTTTRVTRDDSQSPERPFSPEFVDTTMSTRTDRNVTREFDVYRPGQPYPPSERPPYGPSGHGALLYFGLNVHWSEYVRSKPSLIHWIARSVARLTRFEGRGHKKVPKGPPFAHVFWKNFKNKLSKGGGIGFFSPPLDFTGGGGPWPPDPPPSKCATVHVFFTSQLYAMRTAVIIAEVIVAMISLEMGTRNRQCSFTVKVMWRLLCKRCGFHSRSEPFLKLFLTGKPFFRPDHHDTDSSWDQHSSGLWVSRWHATPRLVLPVFLCVNMMTLVLINRFKD